MSYILDALRRADAERQQGQVPGLHAAGATRTAAAPRYPRGLVAALAVILALALLGTAWFGLLRPVAPKVPVTVPATAPVAVPAAGISEPAPQAAPVVAAPPLPIVVSAPPATNSEARPQPSPPAAAVTSASAAATTAFKPVVRSTPLAALSPEERRQLPALVPGGSVWSESAASRFVILDGQVLREGESVAPGLLLEKIERRAALLRWKDQRVEVPF